MKTGQREDEGPEPSFIQFLGGYLLILASGIGSAIAAERYLGLDLYRAAFAWGGMLFLLAAATYPSWLYQIVRRVRWFGLIDSDGGMRAVLVVLGAILLVLAAIWDLIPTTG